MASSKAKQPLRQQFTSLGNLPRFFRLIWHTHRGMTIANVLLRLTRSLIPLASLYVGKLIIDEVISLAGTDSKKSLKTLWTWVGIELALALAADLINRLVTLLDGLLGDLFSNKISEKLIQHAATLDLYQFENPIFYDKLERARRQTVSRMVLMSHVLSQVQDFVTILSLAAGLAFYNPWLLLLLFVAVLPAFLGETYFNERSYSLSRSWTPERRELDYLRYLGTSDQTAKEVKIFGLADFIAKRFGALAQRYYRANERLAIRRAGWGGVLSAISTLAYYSAYVIILLQAVQGAITIGTLTFLAGSFRRMRDMMQGMMMRFSQIAESALYLQDLFVFFEIKPEISSPRNPLQVPSPIQKGFAFDNVGFRYPDSERWAVRGLSFELRAGEKLALVGENGAGKTTLVKLLARLYEPTEGRILLDGIDIRQYDLQELRNAIGIIFQDYVRFHLSASENIAIGHISSVHDDQRIADAAIKSLADTVIEKLPEGYRQILGKRFMEGVELSGGEWQKIALARAYMRGAQLLILDEPTSALDARAEHEVFVRFSELIAGKSSVLISHRFSTVRMADRILFLENGMLREIGTHEELLAHDGKYAELFHLQAKGYR